MRREVKSDGKKYQPPASENSGDLVSEVEYYKIFKRIDIFSHFLPFVYISSDE